MTARRARGFLVPAYLALVVALGAAALVGWHLFVGFRPDAATISAGLALGALCAAARLFPVSVGVGRSSLDVGSVPMFAALVLGGPACALLVAVPSAAHREPPRAAFMAATHALQILTGALAFGLFSGRPPLSGGAAVGFPPGFVLGTLAAGLAFFGLDALVSPVLVRLKYGRPWAEVAREFVLPGVPSDVLAVLTALALGLAASSLGPASALVLLSGGGLSLAALERARGNRRRALRLEAEKEALGEVLRSSHAELVSRLVEGLGSRDGHAAAHAAASAVYARDVAREMGLGEERSEKVRLAALLMDLGLLWVPDEVLLTRPDRLNSLGKTRLEGHPEGGERVLAAVPGFEEAARWVRWHHERPDGTGYPDRLRGEWIPPEAGILAAASLYASWVLDGPHAPALRPEEARRELVGGMSQTVDEEAAKALLRVLDANDGAYAAASDARFLFPAARRDRGGTPAAEPTPRRTPAGPP